MISCAWQAGENRAGCVRVPLGSAPTLKDCWVALRMFSRSAAVACRKSCTQHCAQQPSPACSDSPAGCSAADATQEAWLFVRGGRTPALGLTRGAGSAAGRQSAAQVCTWLATSYRYSWKNVGTGSTGHE